ncbi:hypothetical protein IIA16_01235 [bacterium]|nr:hypothetical protein [bacterium]
MHWLAFALAVWLFAEPLVAVVFLSPLPLAWAMAFSVYGLFKAVPPLGQRWGWPQRLMGGLALGVGLAGIWILMGSWEIVAGVAAFAAVGAFHAVPRPGRPWGWPQRWFVVAAASLSADYLWRRTLPDPELADWAPSYLPWGPLAGAGLVLFVLYGVLSRHPAMADWRRRTEPLVARFVGFALASLVVVPLPVVLGYGVNWVLRSPPDRWLAERWFFNPAYSPAWLHWSLLLLGLWLLVLLWRRWGVFRRLWTAWARPTWLAWALFSGFVLVNWLGQATCNSPFKNSPWRGGNRVVWARGLLTPSPAGQVEDKRLSAACTMFIMETMPTNALFPRRDQAGEWSLDAVGLNLWVYLGHVALASPLRPEPLYGFLMWFWWRLATDLLFLCAWCRFLEWLWRWAQRGWRRFGPDRARVAEGGGRA